MGKLLSLAVNSSMLSLAVDPKGNIMNNEQSRVRVGGGVGGRWGFQDQDREMEGG